MATQNYIQLQPEKLLLFSNSLISELSLTNTSHKYILFKIRTTSPNSYVVKPHLGVLKPGQVTNIVIKAKLFDNIEKLSLKKDKFQVKVAPCPENVNPIELNDLNFFQQTLNETPILLQQISNLGVDFDQNSESTQDSVNNEQNLEKTENLSEVKNGNKVSNSFQQTQPFKNDNTEVFSSLQFSKDLFNRVHPAATEESHESNKDQSEVGVEEKIARLEKELKTLTSDVNTIKYMNQELEDRISKQSELVDELTKEKQKILIELQQTKTNTFKKEKKKIHLANDYEFWHLGLVIVIGLILGGFFSL